MARKTHEDALGVIGAETIIGTGVVVKGNLTSDSDVVIDGTLDGHIKAGGDVIIGINAHITADINGVNVTIAGTVTGNVKASGEARIAESGHIKGDITATGLAISSGAVFIGRSLMEPVAHLAPPPSNEDEDNNSAATNELK